MEFLNLAEVPCISFRYAMNNSKDFLGGWQHETFTERVPAGSVTHVIHTDPATGLKVTIHARRFDDFDALDWVVEFENTGSADTPIIEDILPMDVSVPMPSQERLRLHHANGSACRMDDFLPLTTDISPNARHVLTPVGGRSSNGVLPFMNLQREGCGLILAIGWSGQWSMKSERGKDALSLAAGMERTHLRLHPGEKIRTPRILILPWEGDDADKGNNLLRRLLLTHYMPRINGELVMPPTAQCLQGYFYLTGKASENMEMTALPKAAEAGVEAYWIDACWYGGRGQWWEEVGSWVVNQEKFPNGLKPISDAAHKAGMKFVLWFEPERALLNSLLHQEHPEFLLVNEKNPSNLLLNLGMPEARRYITNLISKLIAENGVDIYRQDFNLDPLPYWQAADAPDRIGMTEIRYVEGLYAFWDELRRCHPTVWIDNCASGGRRLDLETVSRSLPLWPSDFTDISRLPFGYYGLHVGDQCINAGLAQWIPLFGGGVCNLTPYGTRGQIIGGFNLGFHIEHKDFPDDETTVIMSPNDVMARGKTLLNDDFPLAEAKAAIEEWKSIRQFFLGDFHLLLPVTVSYHDWCAWQFHREDMEAGIAMFFRRHRSPFPTIEVDLKSIAPDAQYDVSLSSGYQEAPRTRVNGKELAHMSAQIPEMPGSLLLRYTRVK